MREMCLFFVQWWLDLIKALLVLFCEDKKKSNYLRRKNMYQMKLCREISFNGLITNVYKRNTRNVASTAWKWEKFIWGFSAPERDVQQKAVWLDSFCLEMNLSLQNVMLSPTIASHSICFMGCLEKLHYAISCNVEICIGKYKSFQ